MIHIRTLARVVLYPAICLLAGLVIGFASHPQVVGHKLWLISWAYQSIFHPPAYNAEAVTLIARMRLTSWYADIPGFKVIDWREFGEEARDFVIEYTGDDGTKVTKRKRVWVRWKLWTQNNGEEIIYGEKPQRQDEVQIVVEDIYRA